jgi:hypothetical protein
MNKTRLTVEVDGLALSRADVEKELVELQVEEATHEADAATLTAILSSDAKGGWRSVLEPLIKPKTQVAIELKHGTSVYRFDGRSTQASWVIAPGGESRLTVKAVDRTLELNVEEKVVAWRSSDSSIASSILSQNGFGAEVTDTPDQPDPDVHVVMQRSTDWAFLRALADKWGYVVYLESRGGRVVGVFGPLDPLAAEQTKLSFGFGGDAKTVTADAQLLAGRDVRAKRVKALSTSVLTGADAGTGAAQATTSLGGQTTVLLSPSDVAGEIDPTEASKGLARKSAFALRVEAELDPLRVDSIVRARRTVEVSGLGSALSGKYLVDRTRHRITADRHAQHVTLVRNALSVGVGDFPAPSLGGFA